MIAALVSRLLFLEHFMKQVDDHTDYENHNDDDDDDDDDDGDILWIKTDGSSAALIDFKADRWQSQLGCQ